jgi:hypothetical protein
MANKVQKPSREAACSAAGLVALTVALALVASLLYVQPVIRSYWWIAAVARAHHRGPSGVKPSPVQTSGAEEVPVLILEPPAGAITTMAVNEQMLGGE